MGIFIMILGLMHVHNFHFQMVNGLKILLFLELIVVFLRILIIRKKYDLFLGEGPTQRLDNTTITAKAVYSINVTKLKNRTCWSLNYNETNWFLYTNGIKTNPFKAKDPVLSCILRLCIISGDFSVDNMKKLNWMKGCLT